MSTQSAFAIVCRSGAAALACALALHPATLLADGNAATGKVLFSRCMICHNNSKGAPSRMGPNLFGVVGRRAGTYPGYVYSPALRRAGFVWTVAKLETWLADPQKLVPGNNMPIAGIPNPGQRADLAAYLATLK